METTPDKTSARKHYESMADEATRVPESKPLLWAVELTGDEIATALLALGDQQSKIQALVSKQGNDRDTYRFWSVELAKVVALREKLNDLTTVVVR